MKTIKVTFRQAQILDCIIKENLTQTQTAKKLGCSPANINLTLKRLMTKHSDLALKINKKRYIPYAIPEKFVRR